jgi:hypothetical protein
MNLKAIKDCSLAFGQVLESNVDLKGQNFGYSPILLADWDQT